MFSMLSKTAALTMGVLVLVGPMPQDMLPSSELGGVLKLLMNGGITAILVYIWWSTHTQANEEQERLREVIGDAFEATRQNSREVMRKNQQRHSQRQDQMLAHLEERNKLDRQLVGTLNRLEAKLDQIDDE